MQSEIMMTFVIRQMQQTRAW